MSPFPLRSMNPIVCLDRPSVFAADNSRLCAPSPLYIRVANRGREVRRKNPKLTLHNVLLTVEVAEDRLPLSDILIQFSPRILRKRVLVKRRIRPRSVDGRRGVLSAER
jgi:hypothetical protein